MYILQEQEFELVHNLSDLYADLDRTYHLVSEYLTLLRFARQEVSAVQASFDSGKTTLFEVLDAQQKLADAETSYYRMVIDYNRYMDERMAREERRYLVSLTAQSMEAQQERRRICKELFNDFKETAVGMMENIQEAQRTAEQRWARVAEDIQRELDSLNRR